MESRSKVNRQLFVVQPLIPLSQSQCAPTHLAAECRAVVDDV
jgi:hypothetical protein